MRLLSFGNYVFEDTQDELSDNFKNVVQRYVRQPGRDGGFDVFGRGRLFSEVGSVRCGLWVVGTPSEVDAKLDRLYSTLTYGVAVLTMGMRDRALENRFCRARVTSINVTERVNNRPHLHQRLDMTFGVASPFWLTAGKSVTASSYAVSGLETVVTETVGGTAHTFPTLTLEGSFHNPMIERWRDGVMVDRIVYAGTIASGGVFVVNTARQLITLNGDAVYADCDVFADRMMELLPGSNSLRLVAQAGDSGTLQIAYNERWY